MQGAARSITFCCSRSEVPCCGLRLPIHNVSNESARREIAAPLLASVSDPSLAPQVAQLKGRRVVVRCYLMRYCTTEVKEEESVHVVVM